MHTTTQVCPGDLVVHVIDHYTGAAIPDAWVKLDPKVGTSPVLTSPVLTDASGYARFRNIPADKYTIRTVKLLYLPDPAINSAAVASCKTTTVTVHLTPPAVLGVHSNVPWSIVPSLWHVLFSNSGHAWISITKAGKTTTYGLWPDSHDFIIQRGLANGDGSDIRIGLEEFEISQASRYYVLTQAQEVTLYRLLRENVHWGYTYTCASWASETVRSVVRENVNASEIVQVVMPPMQVLTGTPRMLTHSIQKLEAASPTSQKTPHVSGGDERTSSW